MPELSDPSREAVSEALLELHNEIVFRDSSLPARETSGRLLVLSARIDAALCAQQFSPADWLGGQ